MAEVLPRSPVIKPLPSYDTSSEEEEEPLIARARQTQQHVSTHASTIVMGVAVVTLGLGTVGLLALSILKDYGNTYNACITLGMGITFQTALLLVPIRKDGQTNQLTIYGKAFNFEKDKFMRTLTRSSAYCGKQLLQNM